MERKHYWLGEGDLIDTETQLKRFRDDIDRLQEKANKATTPAKKISDEQIEALRQKYQTVHGRFQKLKEAEEGSSTWKQLRQELAETWEDLANSLKNAMK